jgi:enamine deaminase RidA (YjgF/YER057c/UK114 family)
MNKPEFFVTPGYGERMLNGLHYSQAVKIGNRVETSGQGGWDNDLQIGVS